jgi:hypothetical protein
VKIATGTVEKESPDPGQDGITQVSMEWRHGIGSNPSLKAIPHDQVVPSPQLFDKGAQVRKVVAVVGVPHDDVLATRRFNTAHERASITFFGHMNHARVQISGDFWRTIAAAVICDNYFAVDAELLESVFRLLYTGRQGLSLVKTGHHNGQFDTVSVNLYLGWSGLDFRDHVGGF